MDFTSLYDPVQYSAVWVAFSPTETVLGASLDPTNLSIANQRFPKVFGTFATLEELSKSNDMAKKVDYLIHYFPFNPETEKRKWAS